MSELQSKTNLPQVRLKSELKFTHPWIFQKLIDSKQEKPKNGNIVDILDPDGKWLARGIYNGHARIALRVLTRNPDEFIDTDFFFQKFYAAKKLREVTLRLLIQTNAYRLIHSEGDFLSGLIVEIYGKQIVVEFFSSGMYRLRSQIESALNRLYPNLPIYFFAEEHVQKQESIDIRSPGAPTPFTIEEHGLKFLVAPGSKHKTGFFLDQRDNRKYLGDILAPNLKVLDICCNSGGFAIYAKKMGLAEQVTALDLDEEILEIAEQNSKINQAPVKYVHVDLFPWLREKIVAQELFDCVILDPSKQTRSPLELEQALRKYCDMNRLAIQVTKPGGIFVTFSCTGLVKEDAFIESVRRAGYQAGRELQIFRISGASSDHPFSIQASESRYLKALWCRVL